MIVPFLVETKGKVNIAICYAKVIDKEAIEQIRRMCGKDVFFVDTKKNLLTGWLKFKAPHRQ